MAVSVFSKGLTWGTNICSRSCKGWGRTQEVVWKTWYMGFTSFGGPAVHFQTFHVYFVEKLGWIDEATYQELFALLQALPGSASTKMFFSICWIRGGFRAGLISFFLWCLPGAIAMYGLALGISHVGSTLPGPVYALLCGLNAATVGMIALAAVQLSRNAITDQLSRLLVYFSGAAGILYTSLWYFPVIMIIAGLIAGVWDSKWFQSAIGATKRRYTTWRTRGKGNVDVESATSSTSTPEESGTRNADVSISEKSDTDSIGSTTVSPPVQVQLISWKAGIFFVGLFVASLVVIVAVRAALKKRSRGLSLFSNFYLAGTMIFGGGPVVIPLLREYTVADGWVSPRDFLLGLAIIQAFPGPNFNFAVYLGTLATAKSALPSYVGALISFLGMYTPGFILALGSMGLWSRLRSQHWLRSILRGINAAAVGLIFTAVYRLWRVGLVSPTYQRGTSLWNEPWWLAVTAGSFVGGAWFHIKAPVAILLGGVMGLIWYAIVQA